MTEEQKKLIAGAIRHHVGFVSVMGSDSYEPVGVEEAVGEICRIVDGTLDEREIFSVVWLEWKELDGRVMNEEFEDVSRLLKVGYKVKNLGRIHGIRNYRQARRFAAGWLSTQELA